MKKQSKNNYVDAVSTTSVKLQKVLFSKLTEAARKRVISEFSESSYNLDYLTQEKYSSSVIDAEIVTYEDEESSSLMTVIDIRVFDPHSHIPSADDYAPVCINFDGWSNWLYDYRDNRGNDIDTIFDEYEDEIQD